MTLEYFRSLSPKEIWLLVEMFLIYFCTPMGVVLGIMPNWPIPFLVLTASIFAVALYSDKKFDHAQFWSTKRMGLFVLPMVARFVILSILMGLTVYAYMPEKFLELPRTRPTVWLMIIFAYPILSVYPQEIIYRAFFFHRYKAIFGKKNAMCLMSGLAFGFVHVVFGHWLSVALSFVGGLLFAQTYAKSRSLMLSSIEHALYGVFVFTIGLGTYFYHGGATAFK